jgi:hypothetical protein
VRDQESNDLVGYFGDDPGDPLIVPAGSIACFSTTLINRSSANTTDRMRRLDLGRRHDRRAAGRVVSASQAKRAPLKRKRRAPGYAAQR